MTMDYRFGYLPLILILAGCTHGALVARSPGQTSAWKSVKPELEGYSTERLSTLQDLIAQYHMKAGMVVVNDHVIYSWGDLTEKMAIHSCRKSFLSGLVGIAVSRGKLNLTDTLSEMGVDDIPPSLSKNEKKATVQDLLESRSGIYHLAANDTPGMSEKRPLREGHPPGTFWYYNNWDFNALGGVYEKKTGKGIFDALYADISVPIGMEDFSPNDGAYSYDRSLSQYPGYVMKLSTRDMARFGVLYLHQGNWNGAQVIPSAWVAASTRSYSDASPPAGTGYGYLWWLSGNGAGLFNGVDLGDGAFAAEGYGGHYIVVVPQKNMIVVTRADDAWFNQDVDNRSIGPNREGKFLAALLRAKL